MNRLNSNCGAITSSHWRLLKWAAVMLIVLSGAIPSMAQWTFHNANNLILPGSELIEDPATGWAFTVDANAANDLTVLECIQSPSTAAAPVAAPQMLNFAMGVTPPAGITVMQIVAIGRPGASQSIFPAGPRQAGDVSDLRLPNTLQRINDNAFHENLPNYAGAMLTIPDSVAMIGDSAFAGCKIFTAGLTLETVRSMLRSIGDNAFFENEFAGNLMIPDAVEVIGKTAFAQSGFRNGTLTLESNISQLKTIGDEAFTGNEFIRPGMFPAADLYIPDSVEIIGAAAFSDCGFDGELVLGGRTPGIAVPALRIIGDNAFNGNKFITVPPLIIPAAVTRIGEYAFHGNAFTGDLNIPDSVTHIGKHAFASSGFDQQLNLEPNPGSGNSRLTEIGDNAFWGNLFSGSSALNIPDSVKTIGDSAFESCFHPGGTLSWANAHPSLAHIGAYAFAYNGFQHQLDLPATVENIGAYAFNGNQFASHLNLPPALTNIGNYAFANNLFSGPLTIPGAVVTIGASAFAHNSFYDALSLGGATSLTTIGADAFFSTHLVGNLAFPDSLAFVGSSAFESCVFDNVSSWGTLDTIFTWMFDGTTFTDNLFEIPEQITAIEENAFHTASFGDSVIIRNGVTAIDDDAFAFAGGSRISLPSTGVHLGNNVFHNSSFADIYFRGAYFASAGTQSQPSSQSNIYYVKTAHVDDWDLYSNLNDILAGNDTWEGKPIYAADWDWDTYVWTFVPDSNFPPVFDYIQNDQGWVFAVEEANNALTVTECLGAPAVPSALDFSTSINGGAYQIVNLAMTPAITGGMSPYNSQVASLVIPDSVTNISGSAFFNCGNLTGDLVIPDSVVSIGDKAFAFCAFNGTLTLGGSVETIGDAAFSHSHTVDEDAQGVPLVFPESLTSVGEDAFAGHTFENVGAWGTLTAISTRMFAGVTFTANVFVTPNQITAVGDEAFADGGFGPSGSGSVVFGNAVTSIGDSVFTNVLMDRISLPSTGVSLGSRVFCDMTLQGVYYRGAYPASVGGPVYTVNPYSIPVSYVKVASVGSWNVKSFLGDIEGGSDTWQDRPIVCDTWDWDEEYLEPLPVSEVWLAIRAINVLPGNDVELSWELAQVTDAFGAAAYHYEVSASADLVMWDPCPCAALPAGGGMEGVLVVNSDMPAPDACFFKVKAVAD